MRANPLPLIGGFYADDTRPWSQQDICNWLPVAAESEGTRTPTMAKTPPGLSPFVDTGVADPIRNVYNAEGRLFTVAGNQAYQISNTGVAIPLGAISGAGRVRAAHNQITGGNEVLFVNGSAGWVWNTVTSTLTLITDTGYPGAIDAVFIDGYLIQIEPARRFAFHSDIADALSYNTLDRFTSEVSPDLLVAMAVSNNELILLSETTTEFFENTGAAQQPFRSKRISFQKGCAGRYTVATMDNTVFWLGDDGAFYLLDGYSPRRISTRPIEQAIRGLNWAQAFAFVWEDSGHSVCYWTFPDGLTFGYDASQQKWHRRASYGLDRWRVSDLTYWQNRWIAGDFQNGRLWELDWDYPLEGDDEFISEMTSAVIHDNQSRVLMPRLEVVMDTGQPEVAVRTFPEQPEGPTITGAAPDGTVGSSYGPYAYTVTPGASGIATVALVSGVLPTGLGPLTNAGVIPAGTPTAVGSYPYTVRATDVNGLWDEVADTIVIAEPNWVYLADAYGAGLGGTSAQPVSMAFGRIAGQDALLISAPKEAGDAGTGSRFYLSTNYGQTFTPTFVTTTLATTPTLVVYGNNIWVTFDSRSTFVFNGSTHTYTAGAVSGAWAGSTWACGVWTGSYFVASSNGSDGMFRSATGIGATWANIGANLPAGTSASTLLGMEAFNGVGPNPAHGAIVALRTGTTNFVRSFDSAGTWTATTYSTATPGVKTFECSGKAGSRAVFLTTVSNGGSSGIEFVYTDDYGVSFNSVFKLFSAIPAALANATRWEMVRALDQWFVIAVQGGGGTETVIAEVSDDFSTLTMVTVINAPAPLAGAPGIISAATVSGSRAAFGWRKSSDTRPAMHVYR